MATIKKSCNLLLLNVLTSPHSVPGALTQLEGVCDLGSLKKTRLFPTNTTQEGLQFFLQPNIQTGQKCTCLYIFVWSTNSIKCEPTSIFCLLLQSLSCLRGLLSPAPRGTHSKSLKYIHWCLDCHTDTIRLNNQGQKKKEYVRTRWNFMSKAPQRAFPLCNTLHPEQTHLNTDCCIIQKIAGGGAALKSPTAVWPR